MEPRTLIELALCLALVLVVLRWVFAPRRIEPRKSGVVRNPSSRPAADWNQTDLRSRNVR